MHLLWSLLAGFGKGLLGAVVLSILGRVFLPVLRRTTPTSWRSAGVRRAARATVFAVLAALSWAMSVYVLYHPFTDDPSHRWGFGIAAFLFVDGVGLLFFGIAAWRQERDA